MPNKKNITDHSQSQHNSFKKKFHPSVEFWNSLKWSPKCFTAAVGGEFFDNLQMVDDSGSSCEMCGKKQDFGSSLTTTTSPKSNKPRTHFYFHKSDESSDSNDDLCGDLSWSGEQSY